jgi:hypothetical protein
MIVEKHAVMAFSKLVTPVLGNMHIVAAVQCTTHCCLHMPKRMTCALYSVQTLA